MSTIAIRDGAIYLPCAVVDTYFRGIDAVIVLIQQDELLVMPVHQATAGGCLLKVIGWFRPVMFSRIKTFWTLQPTA